MNWTYIVFLYVMPTLSIIASLVAFTIFKVHTRKIPEGQYLPAHFRVKAIVGAVAGSLSGALTMTFTYVIIMLGLLPVTILGIILNIFMQYLLIGLLNWIIGLILLSMYIKKMSKHIKEQENK